MIPGLWRGWYWSTPGGWQAGGMRTLLNLIWLVLAGFWLAVGYAIAGIRGRCRDGRRGWTW